MAIEDNKVANGSLSVITTDQQVANEESSKAIKNENS